jgi:methyl coenzyme M reductase subunit D
MKSSGINLLSGLNRSLTRLLGMGNGLISHTGVPRYTATKPSRTVSLAKGELHTLNTGGNALTLTVLSGRFWVTQEGDAKDYLLKIGESLSLTAEGITVIEALATGEIELPAS